VEEVEVYLAFCGNYVPFVVRSDITQEQMETLGSEYFKCNLGLMDFRPPQAGIHYRLKAMFCKDRENAAWLDCKRSDTADEEWVLFGLELSDAEIIRVMEQRWYVPLKSFEEKLPRPLENNSVVMFERHLTDEEVRDEEISGVPAVDPMELFHNRAWYRPPRPATPVHFRSIDEETDDMRAYEDGIPKLTHQVAAGPHNVTLLLRHNATPERILEVLYRRTGISGKWQVVITDEGDVKLDRPRKVLLVPQEDITFPKDLPMQLVETRVFFWTLERKSSCPVDASPEQAMLQCAREAKLDDRWLVDRSFKATAKAPPTVIAKRVGMVEFRQPLPDGLEFFVADHVENGEFVNRHRIPCKGGESPDDQAMLVSQAFKKPMKISEWVPEKDGAIHLQCSRLGFVSICFVMQEKRIESWMQVNATTKQKEKLASVLFEQRVSLRRLSKDDEGLTVHEMVPFAQRVKKPKAEPLHFRQLPFPGAPPPDKRSRPPVELRKRYGGLDYRQTRIVNGVISGEKITITYDPTQRDTQVDPDVEAELTGADRDVPGDTFQRTITWVWPDQTTTIINRLSVPVRATPQDLLVRICAAVKIPELNYRFTIITPEDWHYARAIRVEFSYERPSLRVLREVSEKTFKENFDSSLPVFIETDGACAGNDNKQSPGGWGRLLSTVQECV
jgi:hypothetical protein